ncbi:MAG: S8 family serine peptidase [Clostridia bacterium]|nr:S8 family serine peptidase [Clostridia bacterium]
MKRIRKTISVLLTVLMLLSMGAPAFGANTAKSTAAANNSAAATSTSGTPFVIDISTDKDSYGTFGMANITVTVTNVSGAAIENVSAEALFDGLSPAGRSGAFTAQTAKLNNGESLSFSYGAMVSQDNGNLNFFQKIILFIVRLFKGSMAVEDNGFNDGRACAENSRTITFGRADATNTVRVWYAQNGGTTTPTTTSEDYAELIRGVDIDEVYEENEDDISLDEETGITFINNVVIIDFDWDCTDARKAEIINSINGKVIGGIEGLNELHIQVRHSTFEELENIIEFLNRNDDVYAHYDEISNIQFNSTPVNDPFKNDENIGRVDWNMNTSGLGTSYNNWWVLASNLQGAWAYDQYFTMINIGIVDSGFDNNHEDLDILIVSKENSPSNHGTHVAGLIGATHNNSKGIAGVVKNKYLFCYDAENSKGVMKDSNIFEGLTTLVKDYRCKVINFSVGKYSYVFNGLVYLDDQGKQPVTQKMMYDWGNTASEKIAKLKEKYGDFLVVQAAGNGDQSQTSPKGISAHSAGYFAAITDDNCYDKSKVVFKEAIKNRVIIVSSADKPDGYTEYQLAMSSNGGTNYVDIAAPGGYNYSTVAGIEDKENNIAYGQKYAKLGGTSMASPIVAGVASLVWSVNPNFTGAEVKEIVINTAKAGKTIVHDNPASPTTGDFYMVNAKLAVEEAIRRTYGTSALRGTVLDVKHDNQPLADVDIQVKNINTGKAVTAQTDENGQYTIWMPAGTFKLTFNKMGYGETAVDVTGGANEIVEMGEIWMFVDDGNVIVTVKDEETDQPIPGVTVNAFLAGDTDTEPYATTTTNNNGVFSFKLPTGSYNFTLSHENYNNKSLTLTATDGTTTTLLEPVYMTPKDGGNNDNEFAGGDGSIDNPFQVSSPKQFNRIRNNLNAHYIQTCDISLDQFNQWEPIGNEQEPFMGTYNGCNYSIANAHIKSRVLSSDNKYYLGLFGCSNNATFRDITVKNSEVIYTDTRDLSGLKIYIGTLVGYSEDDSFLGIRSIDNIISTNIRSEFLSGWIGGIVGYVRNSTMIKESKSSCEFNINSDCSDCYSSPGVQLYCAGILGYGRNGKNSVIEGCINYSTFKPNKLDNTEIFYSGIVCAFYDVTNDDASIINCKSNSPINVNKQLNGYIHISGITQSANRIVGCTNYSDVTLKKPHSEVRIEGIGTGHLVDSCNNYGNFVVDNTCEDSFSSYTDISGIGSDCDKLCYCINYGNIVSVSCPTAYSLYGCTGEDKIGGICSSGRCSCSVIGCVNKGNLTVQIKDKNRHGYYCIENSAYVGGIIANLSGGNITRCVNWGEIQVSKFTDEERSSSSTGGIVGYGGDNEIQECANIGNVHGIGSSAGIIVSGYNNLICNCYNAGTISVEGSPLDEDNPFSPSTYSGTMCSGITVPGDPESISINNCYNIGKVIPGTFGEENHFADILCLDKEEYVDKNRINHNYAAASNINPSKEDYYAYDLVYLLDDEMRTMNSFIGFDFEDIWSINNEHNDGYPYLQFMY